MTIDVHGGISHSNAAADKLFGYDESLMGLAVSELLDVQSLEALDSFIHPPEVDANIKLMMGKTKSGGEVPLSIHLTSWTDEGGLQYAMILRNLTELMIAERASSVELQRANIAINSARIGVFEYFPIEGRVVVSEMWRELMELSKGDPVDTQVEWRSRVHPDDLFFAEEAVRVCVEGEQEKAQSEYRLLSKDGFTWQWMQVNVAGINRNYLGEVTSLVGSMSNISARKNIEVSLRSSNEQFRSAFENAPIGHAIFGIDGQWRRANKALCNALGFTRTEIYSRPVEKLTHPEDMGRASEQLGKLIAGEIDTYSEDRRYIRKDGSTMWAQVTVSLVRGAAGKPDHIISQVVDMTEQHKLAAMKGEFIAVISHELRTPLTSVLGSLRLLTAMKSENLSEKVKRLLFIAQQNGDRLYSLINDLLDFEKFSANQLELSLGSHNVWSQVNEAIATNADVACRYDVTFKLYESCEGNLGHLDPKRFQQVMTNLLTNAAKFSDTKSEVRLKIEEDSDFIKISVTNFGQGIPLSFRDKIFSAFAQASMADTRSRGGTGLGLVISKQIVEQSGGRIGFTSDINKETTFWFTVPRIE
ncbi:PAS domain S-box protein [Loktanella salsilacus]|uniref:sensor histidine kinase n=1 Tax=Loktanella salsilacus TaxID=195913 RepID=UPI0020B7B3BD|nr:PAS domain S-box protein [Loktanella salsilacus]UTH48825.1 PAS domain S-box protein [Loktanella salsilacus]